MPDWARATRLTAGLVVAVLVVLLLSACSRGSDHDPRGPGLEEAVGYDDAAWDRLLRHHENELVQCMRSRGFEFWSEANWSHLTLAPHGLFSRVTPSAVVRYREKYGYGVAQRVHVLRAELRGVRAPSNKEYAATLSRARRQTYAQALFGDGTRAGCAAASQDGVVTRLQLPEGGELGDAFGDALDEVAESDDYQDWESRIVDCLEKRDISVDDHDPATLERRFLVKLLRLAGSHYTTDDDGNVHYDLKAKEAAGIPESDLQALRAEEMAVAQAEAECRVRAGDDAQRALDERTAGLVSKYRGEVSQLKRALAQFKKVD